MFNFRIQELAEAKGISLEELSQISGVSVERIRALSQVRRLSVETTLTFVQPHEVSVERVEEDIITPIKITQETAADLRKIAPNLNVSVIELIQPVPKTPAFKFNIPKIAQEKDITLEELSKRSDIHPALLAFYSSQAISNNTLTESSVQADINKIAEILECSPEDLKIESELPPTRLRIEELAKERGLSLDDVSFITDLPTNFLNLLATQPIDIDAFVVPGLENEIRCPCCVLGLSCCHP